MTDSKTHSLLTLCLVASAFLLSACQNGTEGPSTAERALDELQRKYDELVQDRLEDPVQWAQDDIENLGDWEYRVEDVPFLTGADFAAQLNEFGNERWEVIWLERGQDGFTVIMKRPAVSILSKIPLSQLGRMFIGGSEGQ